jgi:CBS-domain-containing membrane protein
MISVAEIMSRDVFSVRATADLTSASFELLAEFVSGAPVVDEQDALVGVLSQTDLLRAQAHPTLRVGDVMTQDVLTVEPSAPAEEVIWALLNNHVHRVIVIDAERRVVGVVTAMDVLRAIAKYYNEASPELRLKSDGWSAWSKPRAA